MIHFGSTFQDKSLRTIGAIYVCLIPVIYFVVPDSHRAAPPERFIAWAVWPMMILATLPQSYEVRADDLFLCLRWRRRLIPYVTVAELVDVRNRKGIGSFRAEVNLVRVTTTTGDTYTFGVEEKDRFLSEVLKRCPQVPHIALAGSAGSII
jgi:hypothetical protein